MRVWTVSEEKAGTLTQCLGVAGHLTADPVVLKIERLAKWRRGLLSPYRRVSAAEPDIIVSCGWFAERHVARIKERFDGRPLAVHLQPPAPPSAGIYDLAFVSRHDWKSERLEGTEYRGMIGVPHRITRQWLDARRPAARARWTAAGNDDRIVAMLLGGPNGAYDYDGPTIAGIVDTARRLAAEGAIVLATTSRRSRPALLDALLRIDDPRVHVWDRTGENPYRDYLAAADGFLIGKDTVTMHCEALTSGRPVYSLDLAAIQGERFEKFEWFHHDLQDTLRLTRPFEGRVEAYDYGFADQSLAIADAIRAHHAARRR
ncbi:ELM1/GtrOC1 family putative glycosyltransferase [Aurantimonas sp. HBX-1]|uniref:ELM1/GtrOC1 family putative glycosyltransferase n=1 Tax=Aurantimonas sp. HBX-1 TaxID=2906072 RepID=UPI001F21568D|nr:ELM1/GtrOC1 family putative glycosyltransferase [Aurantimonas sp. HBX-1]UIJ73853.1 mitochondrial fission ELM1 family protein [Aurantimonas sp. HBX-1]